MLRGFRFPQLDSSGVASFVILIGHLARWWVWSGSASRNRTPP
jgi:hypothetical protein